VIFLFVNHSPMAPALLILTDFFRAADCALDYATNLAGPLGARLVLLHVRRDSLLDPDLFTGELSNLNQEVIALAMKRMAGELAVPVVAEIGHGRVVDAVADAVSRHQPLLVVLGRPNQEETPDELVHTTALALLRSAPYPLLIVPATVAASDLPRRVLLAVDGEPFSLGQHAGPMRHLLTALNAELTVLHVATDATRAPADDVLDSVARTGLGIELAAPVRYQSTTAPHPAAGILQATQAGEVDLVVVLARPRSFWGQLFHHSVTAQVLLHSPVPVLVLPTLA
jgi:nucleotide-binding universal stress UspA family protein